MSDWICEGGHPYYLIDGVKHCPICVRIAEVGVKPTRCVKMGHTIPADVRSCSLCHRFTKADWQRQLDLNGEATCPKGHALTHATLAYIRRGSGVYERKCPTCIDVNWKAAGRQYRTNCEARAKREGREMRRVGRPKKRFKPTDYDWVVALRLIEGKIDEVYDMMRGTHKGATTMEKWIAYCSTTEHDSTRLIRRFGAGNDKHLRNQWAEYPEKAGWSRKTLAQAMNEL